MNNLTPYPLEFSYFSYNDSVIWITSLWASQGGDHGMVYCLYPQCPHQCVLKNVCRIAYF